MRRVFLLPMSARSTFRKSRGSNKKIKSAAKTTGASSRSSRTATINKTDKRTFTKTKTRSSGPIVFFIALFIVALGTIQLLSTFYTYAISVSELNGLKREEASLIAQKQELENNIARWNDKAYVAAQAREKLGFVFPGEQVVHVLHPEAVTGDTTSTDTNTDTTSRTTKKALPWYSELAYSFEQADKRPEQTSTETHSTTNNTTDQSNQSDTTTTDTNTEDQQQ